MIIALMVGLVAGAIIGTGHLASLWWSVVLVRDGRPILGVMVQALRFAALALALALIARYGAEPLLAAAFGVLAARTVLLRRLEKMA